MNIIKVSDSIRVFQDNNYYLVNSICIDLGSELLFIDTGIDSTVAKKFRAKMYQEFGKRKASLTITHANNDHFMGLEAFWIYPLLLQINSWNHILIESNPANNQG